LRIFGEIDHPAGDPLRAKLHSQSARTDADSRGRRR
jgi:hypothetical protein